MPVLKTRDLRAALNSDLKKTASEGLENVVDDPIRRIFTARVSGAVLEFGHKQANHEFWTGVKYYGSGSQSRIRVRRTAVETAEAKPAARARKPRAVAVAPGVQV